MLQRNRSISRARRKLLAFAVFAGLCTLITFGLTNNRRLQSVNTSSIHDNSEAKRRVASAMRASDNSESLQPLQAGGQFNLSNSVIAGGGGKSEGSSLKLEGTIGQPAAGTLMKGGQFSLAGGFLPSATDATATPTPTPTPTGTTLQFSQPNYNVGEADGNVIVTVTRQGDTSGTSTVAYITTDADNFTVNCANIAGNAFERCDFATSVDTLTFTPGETSKTFEIPIINDSYAEGIETFGVTLGNPTGATLGTPATATITINDNEAVDGANPIFTTPFFVRQHYLDFLSREPEVGEPWTNLLNNCSDLNNNPACDRLTVSGAFFGSPEFQLKGYFVYRFYQLAFNRLPLYSEIVVDMRAVTGATPAEVFQKKAAFTNSFVQRSEFTTLYNALTNTQFVNTLMDPYSLTSITTPDPAAPDGVNKVTLTRTDLIAALNGNILTRAQVVRALADSDQVFQIEFNEAFVAMQYFGYLRRNPDTAGYNAWLTFLNANPTESRTMINGFMNSIEYRLRFGPPQ